MLACAVLLAGLVAAGSASAQDETVLWRGTMTTAYLTGGGWGFQHFGNTKEGALTSSKFRFRGDTYRVEAIFSYSGKLWLDVRKLPVTCCPVDLSKLGAQWTLHIGDSRSVAMADAGFNDFQANHWPDAPGWGAGEMVDLKIVTTEEGLFPELSVEDGEVEESATSAIPFMVSVRPEPDWPVGVHYETEDGTATGGASCAGSSPPDYVSTEGRLFFGPNHDLTQTVEVEVCDDMVEDSRETFRLVLRSTQLHESLAELRAVGRIGPEGRGYGDEETAGATGTITNDETSVEVSIAADSAYVEEGADAAFTLRRTGDTEEALTVAVAVAGDGAALVAPAPSEVTFAAGSGQAALRVPTVDDAAVAGDGTVTATLQAGQAWLVAEGAGTASATVLDNDVAAVPSTAARVPKALKVLRSFK